MIAPEQTDREALVDGLFDELVDLAPVSRDRVLAASNLDQEIIDEVRVLLGDFKSAEDAGFLDRPFVADGATGEHFHTLAPGDDFEGYQILHLIAEGGMGEVYLALDPKLDRKVALKVVKGNLKTRELLRRFQNERQILANLQHANIARLFTAGATATDLPYFVMEYVAGEPIDKFAAARQLSITDRLKLFRTVCSAVSYAHQNLIVHRDLKPGNILVTKDGEPKLLDFGIAKLLDDTDSRPEATATMFRAMTPEYASPEQVRGRVVTTATDVYSLGVLLFELLTGARPYKLKRVTADEMIKAICEQEAERPSSRIAEFGLRNADLKTANQSPTNPQSAIRNPKLLRGDLDNIVLMALRKDPRRRYASVEQFSEDIRRYLDGLPVKAHKESVSYRASKFVRRNRIAVSAAVVILTTLIGATITTSWEAHVARAERARAERRFNDVRKLADTYMFEFHDSIKDLPGSLPARQLLIKRALEYLDGLAAEAAGDRALQAELAQAYQRVGEISFDVDQIIASRQKAMSINQSLSAAEPANQDYRRALAESYTALSDAMKIAGHTGLQLEYARRAVDVYPAPSNITDQSESDILVTEYILLGLAQDSNGDTNSAIASARRANEIQTVASSKNPNDPESLRALAITLGYLSHFLEDNGQYADALTQSEQALEMARSQLRAEPSNVRYRRDVAMGAMRDGRLRAQLGQTAGALESLNSSLQQLESLSAADPGDKGHRFWLGVAYFILANTLANSTQTNKASANYLTAISITEQLVAADAKWWEAKRYLTDMYVNFGSLQTRNGQTSVAANYFRKAIELAEESSRFDSQNALVRSGLARAYEGMAVLSRASAADPTEKTSRLREALDWYQKSLNIYEDMKRNGMLSGANAGKPDELGTEISRCVAALNAP